MRTNYVLIDFENVQPENVAILDQEWIKVLMFVGKTQTKLPFELVKTFQKMGERAHYVEMGGIGKNALDFHIAYYIGKLASENKEAYFHIVSKDQGFDPLVEHLKSEEQLSVDRIESLEPISELAKKKVLSQPPADRVDYVKNFLMRPNATRPRSRKTLLNHVTAAFGKTVTDEEAQEVVKGLFAHGWVRENGTRIEYSDEEAAKP